MKDHRWLLWLLLILSAIVFADQSRYLYMYPVPDTGMWFGDETWTMLTVRTLARMGIACIPEALGSSLAHSNGLVNGSIWLSGIVYGIPANLFVWVASPVAIGRTVTLVLSIIMLLGVYRLSREVGASPLASLAGVFVLLISNAFYFSSHSARLDTITGLAVLLYYWILVRAYTQLSNTTHRYRIYFVIAFLAVFSITAYVHVPTLIALPALYALWMLGTFKNWRRFVPALAGAVSASLIIFFIYGITAGSFNLLGAGYNQYYNVAYSLPVLHLFSWRVQKINTIDRFIQLWQVAWPLVSVIAVSVIGWFFLKQKLDVNRRFYFSLTVLGILSWMLFEGPAVFYNIYILPVLAVCAALLLVPLMTFVKSDGPPPLTPHPAGGAEQDPKSFPLPQQREGLGMGDPRIIRKLYPFSIALLAVTLTIYTIVSQERLGSVGARLTHNNHAAIHAAIDPIATPTFCPLILADQPAINELAADTNVRLMTNHLLLFGDENKQLPEILKEKGVQYLLLYSTVRWQSPFRSIADSLYTLVDERTGTLTDEARTYDEPDWNNLDTLRLYKTR